MKLPGWLKLRYRRDPTSKASLTICAKCSNEMRMIEKSTMSGDDMRTYRCDRCQKEHIVDFGVATWKLLSDARNSDK